MQFILNALFGKKDKAAAPKKLNAATAKKVLQFISHGLTYGAVSLASHYQPKEKVFEFVAVSGSILGALKRHQAAAHLTETVVISVHVNNSQRQIKLNQAGEHVMLTLDGCEAIINLATLEQLYANLRDDILKHGEIYGKNLQRLASAHTEVQPLAPPKNR